MSERPMLVRGVKCSVEGCGMLPGSRGRVSTHLRCECGCLAHNVAMTRLKRKWHCLKCHLTWWTDRKET